MHCSLKKPKHGGGWRVVIKPKDANVKKKAHARMGVALSLGVSPKPRLNGVKHFWFVGLLYMVYMGVGLSWLVHPSVLGVAVLAMGLMWTQLKVFDSKWPVCLLHVLVAGSVAMASLSSVLVKYERENYRRLGHDRWFWVESSEKILSLGGCRSMVNLLTLDTKYRLQHYQEMKAARLEVVQEMGRVDCLSPTEVKDWSSRLHKEFKDRPFLLFKNKSD